MGNVILTGFMGCGKSSVAIKLSYRLKKTVIDTDKLIEKKQGKSIAKIFEEDGEEVFRQLETETLRQLKNSSRNDIISVGGGTPMRAENRELLKELGTVVYLRATAETIFQRVRRDTNRPLLQCEDPQGRIRELLEKRDPLYTEGAHLIIDVDGKHFGQVLFETERAVRSREMELRAQRDGAGKGGQRPYGERRPFGERKPYGESGYNGTRRFHTTENGEKTEENAQQPISQHAQNIQFALNESARYQEKWQESVCTEKQETSVPEADAVTAEEITAAVETVPAEDVLAEQEAIAAEEKKEEAAAPAESTAPTRLLVINGPNLNFLGIREKGIYGSQDYNYLLNLIARKGIECGVAIEVFQSNHEGAIIDKLQAAYFDGTEGIVINPGAYTHYSYAIRDALACLTVPKVEVHISNIMEREPFRRISVTAPVCDKQIYGQGLDGYLQAIDFILDLKKNS